MNWKEAIGLRLLDHLMSNTKTQDLQLFVQMYTYYIFKAIDSMFPGITFPLEKLELACKGYCAMVLDDLVQRGMVYPKDSENNTAQGYVTLTFEGLEYYANHKQYVDDLSANINK